MKPMNYLVLLTAGAVVTLLLAPTKTEAQESWTDTIEFGGDIRTRFEAIDEAGEVGRERGRFRFRLNLDADVNENVRAIIRLATGGDNPVSTNQTFDSGFSGKEFGVDRAYVEWTPGEHFRVMGGKMSNPFVRAGGNGLVWDSDLNPEGVAVAWESGVLFANAAAYFAEERSSADDSVLLALQGGATFDLADNGELMAGFSYYDYSNTEGNLPLYDGSARGNTIDLAGNLVFDYNLVEVFAEWSFQAGNYPMSVFADFVQNGEAGSYDTGYAFGVALGRADNAGTWQASWVWQDLEADAVIATFTDSNFGGGGTDATGHILRAEYAVADNWTFGGALFINEIDAALGNERDYTRLQLDLEFTF